MNAYSLKRHLHLHLAVVITVAWALLLLALAPGIIGAQPTGVPLPSIRASAVTNQVDEIVVRGQGFTPGGLVKISIKASSGSQVERSMWTVASTDEFYGPHGSIDPVWNHTPAGAVEAVFSLGTTTIFGPNGSQDPARGFTQQALFDGPACALSLDVQALDHETGAVSALAHIAPTCGSAQEPVAAPEADSDNELPPACERRDEAC